ncbi:cytochrome P450 [Streptomyces fuscichromogenes]|uniref:Cytochrome P450 n=1 Tax=Streptomyces fuscichromogenes TaxID=1324013 RepID=A0A918CNZ3_9ACTN|nr:cytochrome P450 [Streptomyces fuscichromogenes]GGM98615.1 cytochrome P450 [Streptomyces fuscichromogenes]
MTDTTPTHAPTAEHAPDFPMKRAQGCPFDPPPSLLALREQGPLVKVRLFDGSTPWLLTRHADQKSVLADSRFSADINQPGYPKQAPVKGRVRLSLPGMDDPEHAQLRRMISGAFSLKRVEAMRPAVQQLVDGFIDDMLAGPNPVDLVEALALPVPSLVICELLGVPYEDHDFFQVNSKTMILKSSTLDERQAAHQSLIEYLNGLLGKKLDTPEDDLLSGLAERVRNGELPRQEAAELGVLLLLGGHETTSNMIALGTLLLLQHPEQLERLRTTEDPQLIVSAVEELLRYLTITHTGRRRVALEDVEIAGGIIRAGEGVIAPSDAANRDPEAFPDPDRLDIERSARHHQAFGAGTHHCLGQPLARLELQVVYGTLYRRIPTLRLATDLEKVPFKHDGFIYGVHELPVTW